MRVAVVVVVKDCLGIKMAWELKETEREVGGNGFYIGTSLARAA